MPDSTDRLWVRLSANPVVLQYRATFQSYLIAEILASTYRANIIQKKSPTSSLASADANLDPAVPPTPTHALPPRPLSAPVRQPSPPRPPPVPDCSPPEPPNLTKTTCSLYQLALRLTRPWPRTGTSGHATPRGSLSCDGTRPAPPASTGQPLPCFPRPWQSCSSRCSRAVRPGHQFPRQSPRRIPNRLSRN